ncbi:MFS transporter [Nocardioides sp. YIM 152588]|uniref:MFS transporter n=1 Tax=Nocardioides sp. YIM 152588 TaxID=3158259 RepID=UPI0032E3A1B0
MALTDPRRSSQDGPTHGRAVRNLALALLALAAIETLALSLRAGVGSLGALLPVLRDDLGLGPAAVGLLTALPTLCFAAIGLGAGRLILRYGAHATTLLVLGTLALGMVARALTDSPTAFILATAVAMAGAAVGNVVLPTLAKLHFPHRVVAVSALYSVAINLGATIAAAAAVPISTLAGWRTGLGIWAALPVFSLLLWMPVVARRRHGARAPDASTTDTPGAVVARTRLGWAMALCFGAQAAQAYVQFGWWSTIITDAGGDPAHAGALLAVIAGLSIPITLALPALMRRTHRSAALPIAFAALTVLGWLGVLLAPLTLHGWPWAILLGLGSGAFAWTLVMIGVRSPTPADAGRLSAFAQGIGYLLASAATFATGLLHAATGSWTPSLLLVLGLAVLIGAAGTAVARLPAVTRGGCS